MTRSKLLKVGKTQDSFLCEIYSDGDCPYQSKTRADHPSLNVPVLSTLLDVHVYKLGSTIMYFHPKRSDAKYVKITCISRLKCTSDNKKGTVSICKI